MEKHCKGCKYKAYEKRDVFKISPYCINPSINSHRFVEDLQHCQSPCITESVITKHIEHAKARPCMLMQSIYNGYCPFRTQEGIENNTKADSE